MKRSYFREFFKKKNEKVVDGLYHSRCTYSNAVNLAAKITSLVAHCRKVFYSINAKEVSRFETIK